MSVARYCKKQEEIPITCFIKAMRVLDNYKETLHNYVYSVNGPNQITISLVVVIHVLEIVANA